MKALVGLTILLTVLAGDTPVWASCTTDTECCEASASVTHPEELLFLSSWPMLCKLLLGAEMEPKGRADEPIYNDCAALVWGVPGT
jgi:hypothetical protein